MSEKYEKKLMVKGSAGEPERFWSYLWVQNEGDEKECRLLDFVESNQHVPDKCRQCINNPLECGLEPDLSNCCKGFQRGGIDDE